MKFSIITPSFRNSPWLKLCIASVFDQGVEHEHIVQDAGSDDGTLDWLPRDTRVKAFVEKDAGMYDAINRGLRRASGDVLAYLNCDEQFLPGALVAVEKFFVENPNVEMVFGDAVAADGNGDYLWHRKMVTPLLCHTWACHLTTLSCAMFFRRSVIERENLFFDPRWRYAGDREWMVRVIQQGVRMGVLRQFAAVFTHTGENISLQGGAPAEWRALDASAPAFVRAVKPLVIAHHRVRRLLGGIYSQAPFDYSLYTRAQPERRVVRHAAKPTFRWKW